MPQTQPSRKRYWLWGGVIGTISVTGVLVPLILFYFDSCLLDLGPQPEFLCRIFDLLVTVPLYVNPLVAWLTQFSFLWGFAWVYLVYAAAGFALGAVAGKWYGNLRRRNKKLSD